MFHARDGAIFSKNSTFVFFDGASPITENGIQLRSPSPIMAPGYEYNILEQQMLKLFFNKRHRDERPEIVKNIYGYLQMFMS